METPDRGLLLQVIPAGNPQQLTELACRTETAPIAIIPSPIFSVSSGFKVSALSVRQPASGNSAFPTELGNCRWVAHSIVQPTRWSGLNGGLDHASFALFGPMGLEISLFPGSRSSGELRQGGLVVEDIRPPSWLFMLFCRRGHQQHSNLNRPL